MSKEFKVFDTINGQWVDMDEMVTDFDLFLDSIVNYMDDDIRESITADTARDFAIEYAKVADEEHVSAIFLHS